MLPGQLVADPNAQLNFEKLGPIYDIFGAAVTPVTALPTAGLVDGMVIYFVADATNGVVWMLRYRAASPLAYKWEFVGGGQLRGTPVVTAQTTVSINAYVDLATVGPTLAIPLAGVYDITISAGVSISVINGLASMAYSGCGTVLPSAPFTDAAYVFGTASGHEAMLTRTKRETCTASGTLTAKYTTNGTGTGQFTQRNLAAVPVAVG